MVYYKTGQNTEKARQLTDRTLLRHRARALPNQIVCYMSRILECLSKWCYCHHGRCRWRIHWLLFFIWNEKCRRYHWPSAYITTRLTSCWRPCCQKRPLLKLSIIMVFEPWLKEMILYPFILPEINCCLWVSKNHYILLQLLVLKLPGNS